MANLPAYRKIIDDFNQSKMFSKDMTDADTKILEYLKKIVQPSWSVLSVGCGVGNIIEKLVCNQYALDASSELLTHCGARDKKLGNMDEMPYEDDNFDLVYMAFVLQQSLNPKETIKEAMRVLKPDGKLIIFDGDKTSSVGIEREKRIAEGTWETCGKAQWFTKDFFNKLGFETDNLLPHVIVATKSSSRTPIIFQD